jgi:hypothetical protein
MKGTPLMKLRTKSRQGPRNMPLAHQVTTTVVILPRQRTEQSDAYTWAVNAALESGQTEAAYEIAAGFPA